MATRLPNASQQAAADAVVDRADGGATAGSLRIYSGVQPADADSAPAGTLLCQITLSDPAYGVADATGTAAAAGTPLTGTGDAGAGAGTNAQSFRVTDSDGNAVYDGAVTGTGGGGELELDNVSIASGQQVTVTSFTYQQPAST